jgi:hypothetical protein
MNQQKHIFFPATPQGGMRFFTTLAHACFLPFEQFIRQISRFHFRASAPSYPFQHAFQQDI